MKYTIKAFRRDVGVITLDIEATNANEAERLLRQDGYHVLGVLKSGSSFDRLLPDLSRRPFPVLIFCEELAALIGAGLSLIEAIDGLHRRPSSPLVDEVIGNLRTSLREGHSLSASMSHAPEHFPELLVANVRSSEETGELAAALQRYIEYRQQLDGLRDKVIAASVYPVLLLIVGGLVVLFLLGYVVPRFSRVFEGLGNDIPFLSRLLIEWGQFASDNPLGLITGFMTIVILTGYLASRQDVRHWLSRVVWRMPLFGERLRVYQLARFTRTLAMLLSGGVPLVSALGMTKDLLNQPALRTALELATVEIREGCSATEAFGRHGLATAIGLQMLAVGERSGELGHMLDKLAAFYDLENERFVAWSTRLIEPLFMAGIGLVVGIIVLLMYFPIFELAGNLG